MTERKPDISEDLQKIVSTTIDSIREGLKDKQCGVIGQVEFEIAVIKSKEGKCGVKFLIADAGGNYCKESVSRIKFNVIGINTPHGRQLGTWLDK
jgi:hexokinase